MGDHPLKKMHHFMEFSWIKNLSHLHFKLDSYFPKSFVSAQTKRLWFENNCQLLSFCQLQFGLKPLSLFWFSVNCFNLLCHCAAHRQNTLLALSSDKIVVLDFFYFYSGATFYFETIINSLSYASAALNVLLSQVIYAVEGVEWNNQQIKLKRGGWQKAMITFKFCQSFSSVLKL